MIRTAVEKLTRRLRFRRRLPKQYGGNPIWVSPSGSLRYLLTPMAKIDPQLLSLAKEFIKTGNVVWDIGANLGYFTFSSAHLCGKSGFVVALEPDVWLVDLLRRSSRIQSDLSAPVRVIPAAVAQSVGLATYCIASRSRSANFLKGHGSTQTGGVAEEHSVVTVSLDWLAERCPQPDVIKIDVEGAELDVLRGARGLLEKKRPILLCEVTSDAHAVTELLIGAGYRLYDGEVERSQRKELDSAPFSTIAIPT